LAAPYSRNFLENKLPQCFEDVPLATPGQMWLHYRAPPHFGRGNRISELIKVNGLEEMDQWFGPLCHPI
jgi:hypothetical protein